MDTLTDALHQDQDETNEALDAVNSYADNMDFAHDIAIAVDDLKNEVADLEEEADAWCDSYGAEADQVRTLKRRNDNFQFFLKSVINERDDLKEFNITLASEVKGLKGDLHRLKGITEYLRAGKTIARLREDVVNALQPWWDSEDTGSSDEDHALIDALPDWVVRDLTKE